MAVPQIWPWRLACGRRVVRRVDKRRAVLTTGKGATTQTAIRRHRELLGRRLLMRDGPRLSPPFAKGWGPDQSGTDHRRARMPQGAGEQLLELDRAMTLSGCGGGQPALDRMGREGGVLRAGSLTPEQLRCQPSNLQAS